MSRILIVEDDAEFGVLVAEWLDAAGHAAHTTLTAEDALRALGEDTYDVVVADLNLHGEMDGLALCERVAAAHSDVPVIVMTAFGSLETAVGAIRVGAYDFVTKPVERGQLMLSVERAATHRALQRQVARLEERLAAKSATGTILGESPAMQRVFELVDRVAQGDTTVLVTGESGTGKELIARALHEGSPRSEGPFVAINCAALPAPLLEAELFGHAEGAFTDARGERRGLLAAANGGTLFLDEIGEMSTDMQVKLLRALQERTYRRVGGTEEMKFDARLISATNRDLEQEVAEGRFREDLFYRINVIRIGLPTLAQRGHDILLLAQAFVARAASRTGKNVEGIARDAAQRLLTYPWPGNVRELENCVESAVAMTAYDHIVVEDLPERIRRHQPVEDPIETSDPTQMPTLREVEQRYVMKVLRAVDNNKSAAARILGFDRRTLYRKLDAFEQQERPG